MKDRALQMTSTPQGFDLDINLTTDRQGLKTGLQVGNTLYQNQAVILTAKRGEIKEYPAFGIGIEEMLNDNEFSLWQSRIVRDMELDGMKVLRLVINEKGIDLNAIYT